jgi:gliding motility-associated lipoprotein GldH
MPGTKTFALSLLMTFMLFQACDNNTVYKEYQDIPDKVWDRSFQPEFVFDNEDTDQAYNVNLHVRNASLYPHRNLWLFIHTTTPTGETSIDTIECVLAEASGQWLGEGMGDIWDNEIPWKQNHTYSQKGKYTYRIEQAMRMEKLPGIMDVGISVEIPEQEK